MYLYLSVLQLRQGSHYQCHYPYRHNLHIHTRLGNDLLQNKLYCVLDILLVDHLAEF